MDRTFVLALVMLVAVGSAGGPASAREVVTAAYLDDPTRDMVLYALTEGIITSRSVEVKFSFLPLAAAVEAFQFKRYDLIEASPMAVAGGAARGFRILIFSAALENRNGTLLFVAADSPVRDPRELRGRTIALASLGGTFALETRFVLQDAYGLNTDPQGGDVRFVEMGPDAIPALLRAGRIDAGVLLHLPAYFTARSRDFRTLLEVTREFTKRLGSLSMNSVVVTYPEVVARKGGALREVRQLLQESNAYAKQHMQRVSEAVAKKRRIDPAYLQWWWGHYDYANGSLTEAHKREIHNVWTAAHRIGMLRAVPDVNELSVKE
ncbi:MAG: ABC transporter substrate-binding protein [Deltaproteobacteria bacterium]|nr:ABC transporter substrate-binding protein [Deltaproteobacteria bacterium]MBI3076488.1 ABC transporter substrate-binding protein [Deltaproteobacteria bacterium]